MPEETLLDEAWSALVAGGADPPPRPELEVEAPVATAGLGGRLPVADTAIACVGVALAAAAALAEHQAGRRPRISLHPGHVAAAVTSERHFRIDGHPAGPGFAPLSRFWRVSDGWVRTHANYPWHRRALLDTLDVDEDPQRVADAMLSLSSGLVEDRVFAAGGVAAAVRSAVDWAAHPQGQAIAAEPLIGHRCIPGAPPRVRTANRLPAEGIRVLDLTRVIAGPVCTRYLGALGADVLRVDPPDKPDLPPGAFADSLLAKRSAAIDLQDPAGLEALHGLLDQADVLVSGYRPGSLERFGLGPDDLAARHPGLVVVSLSAWGHRGPWAERRGFDSVVQAPTGIALAESSDGSEPGALPCQLLDHGTGYLAAAAVLDGLRRQSTSGGTQFRTLSLARTAHWLTAGGPQDVPADAAHPSSAEDWMVEFHGRPVAAVVAPPGHLDRRALSWPGPPACYLADSPSWANGHIARRATRES